MNKTTTTTKSARSTNTTTDSMAPIAAGPKLDSKAPALTPNPTATLTSTMALAWIFDGQTCTADPGYVLVLVPQDLRSAVSAAMARGYSELTVRSDVTPRPGELFVFETAGLLELGVYGAQKPGSRVLGTVTGFGQSEEQEEAERAARPD